ncbi:MAG: hypothetical protein ACLTVV_13600 [Ruminococcus sp.]
MKKELRKSTKNKTMSSYYATCTCKCLNYCGAETPWYPREAEAKEYYSMQSVELGRN